MKNGTYNYVICFSQCSVDKSQYCDLVWYNQKQRSTHNPTLNFWHLILVLVRLFCNKHMIPHSFPFLWPFFIILHFQPHGRRGWFPPWDGLWLRHPSTLFYQVSDQGKSEISEDNMGPQEVRRIKLFKLKGPGGVKQLFHPCTGVSANEINCFSCGHSCQHTPCICLVPWVVSEHFHTHHINDFLLEDDEYGS
jgi:hypothetical protein